jgi:ADP-ribose diphosphatase
MPKRIKVTTKFKGRIFTIKDVTVRHDNGRKFTYEVNEKAWKGGSMICAVDGKGRVVLVREYFPGIDETQLCLPKGKIDEGERPVQTARRELEEETGFRAGKIALMATFTLSPGYSNQRTHVFLATGLRKVKDKLQGDEIEAPIVVVMPLDRAIALAAKGEITEARAVAALLLAREKLFGKGKKR